MELFEALVQRQSGRNYAEQPVEMEKLRKCVEAAQLAPSACNSQPWSFVVVSTPEKVKEVTENILNVGFNKFCQKVPAYIAIIEEPAVLGPNRVSQKYAHGDVGMAVENLCLAATAQGLTTCIMGAFGPEDKMKEILGLAPDTNLRLVLSVGYAAEGDPIRPKRRKALKEVCKFL